MTDPRHELWVLLDSFAESPHGTYACELRARLAVHEKTEDALNVSLLQDPNPMDTVGTLIDKLVTVNLKMWHNQEALYAIRRMTPEQFAACYAPNVDEVRQTVSRCCDLNVQRARLMDAIDDKLNKAIKWGG